MGRMVMIVGNGKTGSDPERAIGAADFVIRFNDCRSADPARPRTDVVAVCNTGRPGLKMLSGRGWKDHPSVVSSSEIWCVRDPSKFADMRAPLAAAHPELDDFCDDHTEGFCDFAAETGKRFRVIARDVHERLDAALSAFSPKPYVVPSSGLVVIAEVMENHLKPGDRIGLAGFSHEGWEEHPWEAERRYLAPHEASGLIVRFAQDTMNRPLSGEQG